MNRNPRCLRKNKVLAQGDTAEDILAEYPGLVKEDIQACLLFASRSLQDVDFMPLSVEG